MKNPLTRLTEKTSTLGNYNRKYLHIISSNIEELTASLEQQGMRDRVHLWSHSLEIPGEMDTILEIASNVKEKLDFLGCYFALQFLHMNLHLVDIIKFEIVTSSDRNRTGKKLMLESGRMFRHLTKCYMERLLDLFLEGERKPEFVMLGVGTRADQDDIDLGIIHKYPEDSENLNRAIGRLASEMFKKANRLHFHLSEHVGEKSFTATIEQFEEILDKGIYDFVIVTEMLGAAIITGDYELFEQFKNRVTNRFYFNVRNKENQFHEGYLRGILGEINSLLTRLRPQAVINPKDDALRPIKTLLSALKLVHGIDKVNGWNIIDELIDKNPDRQQQYRDLERSLSFFELFRHLYQIMVSQDEDIDLKEPGIELMLANIAEMIGFEKRGVVSAKDFMLVIYYEFVETCTQAIKILTNDLKEHLHEISVFKPIFDGEFHKKRGFKGNLAVDFIRKSTFVKGAAYWDDFQEELADENSNFYDEFIESFYGLAQRVKLKVARGYLAGTEYDPLSVIRFLVILGERAKDDKSKEIFNLISRLFVEKLGGLHNMFAWLTQVLNARPGDLNRYLALMEWNTLSEFVKLTQRKPAFPEFLPGYEQLYALADLHHQSSHFFKQHFHKILNKFPIYIKNLHNHEKLKEITQGVFGDLTSLPTIKQRIEQLGDYYDLEFVRVSLLAMTGASSEMTDAEFTEFCDIYTLTLFELCQQDVHLSLGYSMHTQDLFALYATGGHAREQGFDDDYDMIVILDSTEKDKIDFCNKIVGKINFHITKRGILPHHRFADHFGSYVINIDQLAEYLGSDSDEIFIEQSQILCSRMLVGSGKLEQKLQQKIIEPYIFAQRSLYIERLKSEMESRHLRDDDEHKSNIKECRGGCRDIEMLLLLYKVKHKRFDILSRKFLQNLADLEPHHANDLEYIFEHLGFIKKMRDLYRLKVAAHNIIDIKYLPVIATGMGYGQGVNAAEKLYSDYLERTDKASKIIKKLVDDIRV